MSVAPTQQSTDIITANDYDWLIRQCAFMAGDDEIAADLAQETLVEAWRNRHKLSAPAGRRAWLVAIARNVYQRWQRRRFRDNHMLTRIDDADPAIDHLLANADDFTHDLERDELATLLDRALALLPHELRLALIAHYVEDLPQSEIAAQLGINQGTLAVRLHRGKLALRQIFANDLHDEAAAFGIGAPATAWTPMRLWCPICGQRRMLARFDATRHHLRLSCPACGELINHQTELVAGARSPQAAFKRVLNWADPYYTQALATRAAMCLGCGKAAPVRFGPPSFTGMLGADFPVAHVTCDCSRFLVNTCDIPLLALTSATGQAFWQSHPHMRLHGLTPREFAGADALLITFAAVTDSARLTLVVTRDTYRVIDITTSA